MTDTFDDKQASIKLAATVLLLRDRPDGLEVFMVLRHQKIDFASGALVFPGGKLADGDFTARAYCDGVDGLSDDDVALRVAAIREAFEECGVLLATEREGGEPVSAERLHALGPVYRERLDRGELGIVDMLEPEALRLACSELLHFAHWCTPSFMPKRFDTHFYLARANETQIYRHDGREAVDSLWIRPQDAIERAGKGEFNLVPATTLNLEKLGECDTVDAALEAARASQVVRVEPQVEKRADGVWLTIPAEAGYGRTEFLAPSPG